MAPATLLLRQVNLLEAADRQPRRADVLVRDQRLLSLSADVDSPADAAAATVIEASSLWLAPGLVDPHSVLREPLQGRDETLDSLAAAAAAGGYSTVALLPWARRWRDRPEAFDLRWPAPLRLLLWGAFSLGGDDQELAPHGDQLEAGACGLAAGSVLPPLALLERGLRLGEMGPSPVLVAPRDQSLCRDGFVRERVEAFRSGWPVDPPLSELLPLQLLLTLAATLPEAPLRLMNLSTAEGVDLLRGAAVPPPASVFWWHLLADCGRLDPAAEGWRLIPSLGGPGDRDALITALAEGLLSAVAVQHEALDAEERLLPLDQRRPGIAGHGLVLPMLWQELVVGRGWSPALLWQALCWGPCRFLGLDPSRLEAGTRDWILFDPDAPTWPGDSPDPSMAANRPDPEDPRIRGRVLAAGFREQGCWDLAGCRSC
jgi:dihydroorotase